VHIFFFYLWVLRPVAYLSDSLCRRQSQQSFNTLTPFKFLFYSLHFSTPTGHPQVRHTISYYYYYYYLLILQFLFFIFFIFNMITCIRTISWSTMTTNNIPISNCIRATDSLYGYIWIYIWISSIFYIYKNVTCLWPLQGSDIVSRKVRHRLHCNLDTT
jgi:hypothetical protein